MDHVADSLFITEKADFAKCKQKNPPPAPAKAAQEEEAVKPFIDKLTAAIKLLREKLRPFRAGGNKEKHKYHEYRSQKLKRTSRAAEDSEEHDG